MYGSGSFYHRAKIVRKTSIPIFCDSFWLFIFENYVIVPLKVISRIFFKFFVDILKVNDENSWIRIQDPDPGSGSISQRHGSADPDPSPRQNVMDPQHWVQHNLGYGLRSRLISDSKFSHTIYWYRYQPECQAGSKV
jgi:hypothetical protein